MESLPRFSILLCWCEDPAIAVACRATAMRAWPLRGVPAGTGVLALFAAGAALPFSTFVTG